MPYSEKKRDEINELLLEIGARFKMMREALGMTQWDVANLVGMTAPNVGHIERGGIFPPVILQLALYREKGVNLHWLLAGDGDIVRHDLTTREEAQEYRPSGENEEESPQEDP